MSFASILVLAVGLAMDAMAVAAAKGVAARTLRISDVLRVALLFGGFQALMPAIGVLLGQHLGSVARAWDHWIAFVLLTALGGKLLWEARHAFVDTVARADSHATDAFDFASLVLLAVATSLDAFAVGITLPMLNAPLLVSFLTIGVTTALLSGVGVVLGRRFGALLGRYFDVFGGLVLIGLGVKVLVEHLTAA
jgi:putative Mn2+ efflux pump MntP